MSIPVMEDFTDPRQHFRPVMPKTERIALPAPVPPETGELLHEIQSLKMQVAAQQNLIKSALETEGVANIDEKIMSLQEKRAELLIDAGVAEMEADLMNLVGRLNELVSTVGPKLHIWKPDAIQKSKDLFSYPGIKILRSKANKREVLNKDFIDDNPLLAADIATFKLKDLEALVTMNKLSKAELSKYIKTITTYSYSMED